MRTLATLLLLAAVPGCAVRTPMVVAPGIEAVLFPELLYGETPDGMYVSHAMAEAVGKLRAQAEVLKRLAQVEDFRHEQIDGLLMAQRNMMATRRSMAKRSIDKRDASDGEASLARVMRQAETARACCKGLCRLADEILKATESTKPGSN